MQNLFYHSTLRSRSLRQFLIPQSYQIHLSKALRLPVALILENDNPSSLSETLCSSALYPAKHLQRQRHIRIPLLCPPIQEPYRQTIRNLIGAGKLASSGPRRRGVEESGLRAYDVLIADVVVQAPDAVAGAELD